MEDILVCYRDELKRELEAILDYWMLHTADTANGGFVGRIDHFNTIYPDESLSKKYEVKRAWISGLQKQAIVYKNNTNSTIISVRFKTGGFFCLTKIPITAIDHVGIEAEDLLGASFGSLYQRIINAQNVPEMSI